MSSQLRVDKILPVDGAPTGGGGGIIQVVQTIKKDQLFMIIDEFTLLQIKPMTINFFRGKFYTEYY